MSAQQERERQRDDLNAELLASIGRFGDARSPDCRAFMFPDMKNSTVRRQKD